MPALVVLGARNLGGAILEHHLAAGWSGAAVARSADTLERVTCAGALALEADASDPESLRGALERARAELGGLRGDAGADPLGGARAARAGHPRGAAHRRRDDRVAQDRFVHRGPRAPRD